MTKVTVKSVVLSMDISLVIFIVLKQLFLSLGNYHEKRLLISGFELNKKKEEKKTGTLRER